MGIRGNDTHMSSSPLHLINPPPPLSSAAIVRRRRPSSPPPLSACRRQSPFRRPLSKKGEFYSQRGARCGSDILPKCRGLIWTHVAAIDGGGGNGCDHCKLASPRSPSHGQCECYFCQLRYFVLLYSLAVWRTVPNFVGPSATRRECHTLLKRRV
jgi:hypothetical protein